MKAIDSFLLDRVFQPFAHWFQDWTGKNNFSLSRVFIYISYFCHILYVLSSLFLRKPSSTGSVIIRVAFSFLALFLMLWTIGNTEREVKGSLENALANPRKLSLQWVRIFSVFLDISNLYIPNNESTLRLLTGILAGINFTLSIYFVSCTPKPPSTSKFRLMVKSFVTKFTPQFAFAPTS